MEPRGSRSYKIIYRTSSPLQKKGTAHKLQNHIQLCAENGEHVIHNPAGSCASVEVNCLRFPTGSDAGVDSGIARAAERVAARNWRRTIIPDILKNKRQNPHASQNRSMRHPLQLSFSTFSTRPKAPSTNRTESPGEVFSSSADFNPPGSLNLKIRPLSLTET